MRTDDFDFDLPQELIAQTPAVPRDSSRLLDIDVSLNDRQISDLPSLLRPGDVMVFNDTRVIPARLTGRRGAAKIEITLHKQITLDRWLAFAKPARRLKPGDRIEFALDFHADVEEKRAGGEISVRMSHSGDAFMAALVQHGTIPLPPYIKRPEGPGAADLEQYQTIYARHDGAVAAPTAGLHFSEPLFSALDAAGIIRVSVTLHVGAGTFLPVTANDVSDHDMHSEWGRIDASTADAINAARQAGGRVVAVGTTALRLLESAARDDGTLPPFEGDTSLFILPGFRFRLADLLLTNFHLPRSTLFMLTCAFAGSARMKAAYAHAVQERYRFYSYGDACLLHRDDQPHPL
jgi:S-adenosylmethionine:tRNA ribosyltransferase-isomerase